MVYQYFQLIEIDRFGSNDQFGTSDHYTWISRILDVKLLSCISIQNLLSIKFDLPGMEIVGYKRELEISYPNQLVSVYRVVYGNDYRHDDSHINIFTRYNRSFITPKIIYFVKIKISLSNKTGWCIVSSKVTINYLLIVLY